MIKILTIWLLALTESTNVTDRQTHSQTDRHSIGCRALMHSIAQQKQFTPRRRSDATTAVCLSVCLSFVRSVSRITHDRVYARRPNMAGTGKAWPSIFWCLSGCESTTSFSFSLASEDRAFYTIYRHSPEGDTAVALAEFALAECSCCLRLFCSATHDLTL